MKYLRVIIFHHIFNHHLFSSYINTKYYNSRSKYYKDFSLQCAVTKIYNAISLHALYTSTRNSPSHTWMSREEIYFYFNIVKRASLYRTYCTTSSQGIPIDLEFYTKSKRVSFLFEVPSWRKSAPRRCVHTIARYIDTGHWISSVNICLATGSGKQVDRFTASLSNQPIVSYLDGCVQLCVERRRRRRFVLLATTAR